MLTGFPLMIVFVISVVALLLLIIKVKMNPFLAMIIVSILTGFLVRMPIADIAGNITTGFGNTLASVGIVIGLGIIFGNILSEARATESIAKGLLKITGTKQAALAVTIAGFLISIPVFMDAAFVIMMPIVKYVAKESKKSLMTFICALGVGTIVGHALVIPTPGPVTVAGNMNANVSGFLLYSLIAGFFAILIAGYLYGKVFSKYPAYEGDENMAASLESGADIPSFGLSMTALLFPIVLILVSNVIITIAPAESAVHGLFTFLGDKNIALLLGCIGAILMLKKNVAKDFNTIVVEAADSAGLILLITGGGGAFGRVISQSGIGDYLVTTMSDMNVSPIILGFALSSGHHLRHPWARHRRHRRFSRAGRPGHLRRRHRLLPAQRLRLLGTVPFRRHLRVRHPEVLDGRRHDRVVRLVHHHLHLEPYPGPAPDLI